MSRDPEGNGFHMMSENCISTDLCYDPNERHYADNVGYRELTQELIEEGYTEDDVYPHYVPCVILWP